MQCEPQGEDAFFPVVLVSPDDVPYMAFIYLAVPFKDWICGYAVLMKLQDFLLVFTWDLGIRNDERRDQGMCFAAETAFDTLYD